MNDDALKKYFKQLMTQHSMKTTESTDELITQAITDGKDDFRGAFPWSFKETHDTVSTTASQETVDLPDDFEGLISVVERTSSSGGKLTKMSSDEYDRMIPDSEGLNEGTPIFYKVYYDGEDGVWKLALYPTPSAAIDLYLGYHVMGEIPSKYIGGLKAAVAKHLFVPGSPQWMGAFNAFAMEVQRLANVDSPDVSPISKVLDSGDEPAAWNFSEYMRVGQG